MQDIQLVCEDNHPDCGHIFQEGAVDTIVRLPDSVCYLRCWQVDVLVDSLIQCGPIPFARVAKHDFLQPNVSSRDNRFNGAQIHVMSLDTNFTDINPSQYVLPHRELSKFTPTFFFATEMVASISPFGGRM